MLYCVDLTFCFFRLISLFYTIKKSFAFSIIFSLPTIVSLYNFSDENTAKKLHIQNNFITISGTKYL